MSSRERIPKTLVIGAKGFLGSHFLRTYRKTYPDAIGTVGLEELDLAHPRLEKLNVKDYEYAVISAGVTKIAKCESDPAATHLCNVSGTLELVKQLHQKKIIPILFSTDYVFDGIAGNYDEDSPFNPLNEYGKQKVALQKGLQQICGNDFLLIRPSKIFGQIPGDGTLLDEMATKLQNNEPVFAAYDQIFCPILITDVVESVITLQKMESRGVFHVCGQKLSRLEIAEEVAKKMGASPTLIKPISLTDLKEPFIRPKNTSMRCDKFQALTQQTLKPIKACIEELREHYKTVSSTQTPIFR